MNRNNVKKQCVANKSYIFKDWSKYPVDEEGVLAFSGTIGDLSYLIEKVNTSNKEDAYRLKIQDVYVNNYQRLNTCQFLAFSICGWYMKQKEQTPKIKKNNKNLRPITRPTRELLEFLITEMSMQISKIIVCIGDFYEHNDSSSLKGLHLVDLKKQDACLEQMKVILSRIKDSI